MKHCRHYVISGRVQGVFYRASTRDMALQLGLSGWVKNRVDGNVETIAGGTEQQLQDFEQWLAAGPPLAVVEKIEKQELGIDQCREYQDFVIKYS